MKLCTTNAEGAPHATVSGVLMASEAPKQHLPGAFIQAVCCRGINRTRQLDAHGSQRNFIIFAAPSPHGSDGYEYQ